MRRPIVLMLVLSFLLMASPVYAENAKFLRTQKNQILQTQLLHETTRYVSNAEGVSLMIYYQALSISKNGITQPEIPLMKEFLNSLTEQKNADWQNYFKDKDISNEDKLVLKQIGDNILKSKMCLLKSLDNLDMYNNGVLATQICNENLSLCGKIKGKYNDEFNALVDSIIEGSREIP